MMMMQTLGMVIIAFVSGSLPFSVWLGQLFLDKDVRSYGDGNPGAANAFRMGNKVVGLLALVLDISKGAIPVGLANFTFGFNGLPLVLISLAPTLGHAFSPFLHFKGGKAIAVTFGVWIGLTAWVISLPAVLMIVVWTALLDVVGWALMLTLAGMLVTLLVWMPDPYLLAVWVGQVVILSWTHRTDLHKRPHLRPWLTRRLGFGGK
jgi:acyl phosphate:glycerol-3-phosphate acyltransferase